MLIANENLVKKIIGVNMFQTGIFLFFVSSAYRVGGSAPIVEDGGGPYVSPLPQVIVLTAIISGEAVLIDAAIALALVAFLGTLAFARFIERRERGDDE